MLYRWLRERADEYDKEKIKTRWASGYARAIEDMQLKLDMLDKEQIEQPYTFSK